MFFRTQNVLMYEGKMRHVEEVLDHAKTRGTHLHPTEGHEAAIGLVGFRDIEYLALRFAERCPDATVALAKWQRRPAFAVVVNLCDHRHAAVIAAKLDILPEQPGTNWRAAQFGAGLDRIPMIELGFVSRLFHLLSPRHPTLALTPPLHTVAC